MVGYWEGKGTGMCSVKVVMVVGMGVVLFQDGGGVGTVTQIVVTQR